MNSSMTQSLNSISCNPSLPFSANKNRYILDNLPESTRAQTHIFNTFFWTNLNKKNSNGYSSPTPPRLTGKENEVTRMSRNGLQRSTYSPRNMSSSLSMNRSPPTQIRQLIVVH